MNMCRDAFERAQPMNSINGFSSSANLWFRFELPSSLHRLSLRWHERAQPTPDVNFACAIRGGTRFAPSACRHRSIFVSWAPLTAFGLIKAIRFSDAFREIGVCDFTLESDSSLGIGHARILQLCQQIFRGRQALGGCVSGDEIHLVLADGLRIGSDDEGVPTRDPEYKTSNGTGDRAANQVFLESRTVRKLGGPSFHRR
jgi:hypothetical protein